MLKPLIHTNQGFNVYLVFPILVTSQELHASKEMKQKYNN